MTEDQVRALIAQWRARAKVNDRASIDHPEWADDLKAMADVWAVARRECATELEALLAERPQPPPTMADAAEMLWVVLANVSDGRWTKQSAEWQEAAARGRDYYFAALKHEAAERPQPQEAQTWQPIATCPKDGTWFLAFDYDGGCYVFRDGPGFIESEEPQPTHWMPLPKTPKPLGSPTP